MSNEKDANAGLLDAAKARKSASLVDFQAERAKRRPNAAPPTWTPHKPEEFSIDLTWDPEPGP